jgi:UDP-2,3-diacylglucosamine pyrophosphatase LpxH
MHSRIVRSGTLVAFVSNSHIDWDPGCDGFEYPEELEALFDELTNREGLVELFVAGGFFDILQIGGVSDGTNRALLTIERPEYEQLFAVLRRFEGSQGKYVIYLPGNHDAESFLNPESQKALR